jgi:hypothetical protein
LRDQSSRRLRPAAARAASALLICVDRRGEPGTLRGVLRWLVHNG